MREIFLSLTKPNRTVILFNLLSSCYTFSSFRSTSTFYIFFILHFISMERVLSPTSALSSTSLSSTIVADSSVVASPTSTISHEINYFANKSYSKTYSAYSADQLELINNPPPRTYAASVAPFIKNLSMTAEELQAAGVSLKNRNFAAAPTKAAIPWDPSSASQSSSFYYSPDCNPLDISHSGFKVSARDGGVFIDSVASGSVGEAAGFCAGDQILFAHNRDITNISEFILVLNKIPSSIKIRVKRNGEEINILLARSSRRDRY